MKKLSWISLIFISLFWLGLNFRNNAVGAIFMPYLVEKFAHPDIVNSALGVLRTAGLIVAMLIQPAAGLLSDRSMSRYGRRRPFIFPRKETNRTGSKASHEDLPKLWC